MIPYKTKLFLKTQTVDVMHPFNRHSRFSRYSFLSTVGQN